MPHPLVTAVPTELLERRNARRLERWFTNRGFRPTLLDIETERLKRGLTGDWTDRPGDHDRRKAKR